MCLRDPKPLCSRLRRGAAVLSGGLALPTCRSPISVSLPLLSGSLHAPTLGVGLGHCKWVALPGLNRLSFKRKLARGPADRAEHTSMGRPSVRTPRSRRQQVVCRKEGHRPTRPCVGHVRRLHRAQGSASWGGPFGLGGEVAQPLGFGSCGSADVLRTNSVVCRPFLRLRPWWYLWGDLVLGEPP